MKNKVFVILAFIIIPWCAFSQNTYIYYSSHTTQLNGPELSALAQLPNHIMWSDHTYFLNGPELSVYQNTFFANGCLPLDSVWWSRDVNTLELNLLFNSLVAGPTIGCARVDTVVDTIIPCHPCRLIVNCHEIVIDSTWTVDTAWFNDSDTSYFSYLSSEQYKVESDLEIYPNPASGFLYLEGDGLSNSIIRLFDLSGREVRMFDGSSHKLDLSGFKSGVYYLILENREGNQLIEKLIVE